MVCTPLSSRGVDPPIKFSKGGHDRISIFRGGLQVIRELKSEIFNDKKSLYTKMFFSVITKNLHLEILAKNLVTFKGWDEVKGKNF